MTDRMPFDFATARYRRAYETADRQLAARLVAAFDAVIADLEREAARIVASLDGELSVSQAMRLQRTATLIRQAETEIDRLIPVTRRLIVAGEIQGATLGATAAEGLTAAASGITAGIFPGFNRLPTRALIDLVASLDSNTPLGARLDQLGDTAAQVVREGLEAGLGAGRNPNAVASRIRSNLVTLLGGIDGDGVPRLGWLQQISRTSMLTSYRRSTIMSFQENSRIVKGWVWSSARDSRVCLNCLSRDGSEWPLDTFMAVHRNCRCAVLPKLRRPYGPLPETGQAWFERQPVVVQEQMMGPKAYALYAGGDVQLADFQGEGHDPVFGPITYQRSVRQILER